MIKHFFTENLPLKVLSLLIALLLWLLVVNVSHHGSRPDLWGCTE